MKRASILSPLMLACVALCLACSSAGSSRPPVSQSPFEQKSTPTAFKGRVIGITDGDTIRVLDPTNQDHKIRLQGIDAPERGQAFGTKSRQNLSDLVFDKQITIEYSKRDRYGRLVGRVLLNGRDICLEQIKAGMAWHYKHYQGEQSPDDRKLYANAEEQARAAGRGLWTDSNPWPPWEFRNGKLPH